MHQFVDDVVLYAENIDFQIVAETDAYLSLVDEFFAVIAGEYAFDMLQEFFENGFFPFGRMILEREIGGFQKILIGAGAVEIILQERIDEGILPFRSGESQMLPNIMNQLVAFSFVEHFIDDRFVCVYELLQRMSARSDDAYRARFFVRLYEFIPARSEIVFLDGVKNGLFEYSRSSETFHRVFHLVVYISVILTVFDEFSVIVLAYFYAFSYTVFSFFF